MPLITDVNQPEAAVSDRRRPGRSTQVSPELIPILRGDGTVDPSQDEIDGQDELEQDDPEQLAAARGILTGVLLSAPLWIGIAYVGHWLLS